MAVVVNPVSPDLPPGVVVERVPAVIPSVSRRANLLASEQHSIASAAMSVIYQTKSESVGACACACVECFGQPVPTLHRGWDEDITLKCTKRSNKGSCFVILSIEAEAEADADAEAGSPLPLVAFECGDPRPSKPRRPSSPARRPRELRQKAALRRLQPAGGRVTSTSDFDMTLTGEHAAR